MVNLQVFECLNSLIRLSLRHENPERFSITRGERRAN